MKKRYGILMGLVLASAVFAGTVSDSQEKYVKQYKKQKNPPKPSKQLVNTDKEPNLKSGLKPIFNGKSLKGWVSQGGHCTFEVEDGAIVGTVVKGSKSTFLCTKKKYSDFIFTCEMKWIVDGNSGVQFRSRVKGKKVFGPQFEMEGFKRGRGWSGGIYGQDCGGWYYPLWLKKHKKARAALVKDWNRITIYAKGDVVKTWINGVPAAHWVSKDFKKGIFGLQVHQGKEGKILWRNIKIKEL